MLEAGIKPVYVFDGQPPAAKKEELARRRPCFLCITDAMHSILAAAVCGTVNSALSTISVQGLPSWAGDTLTRLAER